MKPVATDESPFVKSMTSKFIQMIASELSKTETQRMIKKNIIHPLVNILYVELYPYIITMIVIIILILILSLLTFICFILNYLKKA